METGLSGQTEAGMNEPAATVLAAESVALAVFDPVYHTGRPFPDDPAVADAPAAPLPRQYVSCRVGCDTYAMRIEQLREIIEFRCVTEVPMTPDFCRGVINLRGAVIPVIDLAQRLGRGPTPEGRRTCILIVELPTEQGLVVAGVMVTGSRAVIAAPWVMLERSQFEAGQPDDGVIHADFIEDLISVDGAPQVALNLQRALAPEALSLLIGRASGRAPRTG